MSFDPNAHREASHEGWEEAAAGWTRRSEMVREFAAPVSHWLIEEISPQPGQRLLELAAGLGETGLLAAELLAPAGSVILSDQAEAMLAGARERARELGVANVEFQVLNAEWIDLPLASVDAVICRWGYMLMADPGAALAETRRVLRPGGRLALAVWDELRANPWALLPAQEIAALAGADAAAAAVQRQAQAEPGPFALDSAERVRELLEDAGFTEVRVEALDLARRHASFEEFWEVTLDLSRRFHDAVLSRPQREIEEIERSLAERMRPYTTPEGALELPARTLVASATA